MRNLKIRILAAFLSLLTLIGATGVGSSASSYASDWHNWTQKQSSVPDMRLYGCVVVAMAMMLKDCKVASEKNFTPDTFMEWEISKGLLDKEEFLQKGFEAPHYFAKARGYRLVYEGKSRNVYDKIYDNIAKGYYSIVSVSTGRGRHFCFVDNELSTASDIYCYNTTRNEAHYLSEFSKFAVYVYTYIPEHTPSSPNKRDILKLASYDSLPVSPTKLVGSEEDILGQKTTSINWKESAKTEKYVYMLRKITRGKPEIVSAGQTESAMVSFPSLEDGNYIFSLCSVNPLGRSETISALSFVSGNGLDTAFAETDEIIYSGHSSSLWSTLGFLAEKTDENITTFSPGPSFIKMTDRGERTIKPSSTPAEQE